MHHERTRDAAPLRLPELVAIALGGMVGGGIFTILGISVATIGVWTPVAIALGGAVAALAAYSYVKLGVHYRDEGATYAFVKRSFPGHDFLAALIGWWVVFGYISTIALYAYTFASYAISGFAFADNDLIRKGVALAVIGGFLAVNLWSVHGMGRLEDLMVYSKIVILLVVAGVLWGNADVGLAEAAIARDGFPVLGIITIASVTFVAYEGFQLVINATNDMDRPDRNIPRAIYWAVAAATTIYVVLAIGAIAAIPFDDIISKQEYALAAGASDALGPVGEYLVIAGALLATMSAISGTLYGASRQMAAIARDGYLPPRLARRTGGIPRHAVAAMALCAMGLIAIGSLRLILEFGSITFLLVCFLMALTNHLKRHETGAHPWVTVLSMAGLGLATVLILIYEARNSPEQLAFVLTIYAVLTILAAIYARLSGRLRRSDAPPTPRRG